MGVDEQVLFDLQASWEQKLIEAKVFDPRDFPITSRDYGTANPSGFFAYGREGGEGASMRTQNWVRPGVPPSLMPIAAAGPYMQRPVPPYDPLFYPQSGRPLHIPAAAKPRDSDIPQVDGACDTVTVSLELHIPQVDGEDDQERSETPTHKDNDLGSDLDDEEDDETEQNNDIDDIVLCLYEKVHRTRNKWRCNFKAGIAHIRNMDYAFSKANGDFEW